MSQASIFDSYDIHKKAEDIDPWGISCYGVTKENITCEQIFINFLQFYVECGSCDESSLTDLLTSAFNKNFSYENKKWTNRGTQQNISSSNLKKRLKDKLLYYFNQMEIKLIKDNETAFHNCLKQSRDELPSKLKDIYKEFKIQNTIY
jgi:hypothetical protein